MKEASGIIYK